jgi:hypothetical protein
MEGGLVIAEDREYSIFVEGLRKIIITLNHSRQSLALVLKRGPCEVRQQC